MPDDLKGLFQPKQFYDSLIFAVHIVAPHCVMEGKTSMTGWLIIGGCSKLENNTGNPAGGLLPESPQNRHHILAFVHITGART